MDSQINLNPQEIHGNWRAGYALDYHTVSRHAISNKTHTAIGEMVYQVKYQQPPDQRKIKPLAAIAAKFVRDKFVVNNDTLHRYLNAIIPTPPSETRSFQPVSEIAEEIGNCLNRPVYTDYLIKARQTKSMKGVPKEERSEEINGAFAIQSQNLEKRWVLLFDDIYDTEATLKEATRVLYEQGCVRHVYVLALTQTRAKK